MVNKVKNILDPNRRVRPVYKRSERDGKWRWTVRSGEGEGVHEATGPVRGFDTREEAETHAKSLLNLEGE